MLVVADGNDGDGDHEATGPPAINRCVNAAPSRAPRSKTRSLKVKSEALFAESLPSSKQSIPYETDGLPMFAKQKWCTFFLPTLYACLGSATNPWQLYEDGSTFLITLQVILEIVYPKSGFIITPNDKIYSMVRTGLSQVGKQLILY